MWLEQTLHCWTFAKVWASNVKNVTLTVSLNVTMHDMYDKISTQSLSAGISMSQTLLASHWHLHIHAQPYTHTAVLRIIANMDCGICRSVKIPLHVTGWDILWGLQMSVRAPFRYHHNKKLVLQFFVCCWHCVGRSYLNCIISESKVLRKWEISQSTTLFLL